MFFRFGLRVSEVVSAHLNVRKFVHFEVPNRRRGTKRPSLKIEITDPNHCWYCKAPTPPDFGPDCRNCGFPQHRTFNDHKHFVIAMRKKKSDLASAQKGERTGGGILGLVAFLYLCFVVFRLYLTFGDGAAGQENQNLFMAIFNGVPMVIFAILWLVGRKKPFVPMIIGICIYGLMTLAGLVVGGFNLFLLPLDIMVIGALIYGINSASKAKRLNNELSRLPVIK